VRTLPFTPSDLINMEVQPSQAADQETLLELGVRLQEHSVVQNTIVDYTGRIIACYGLTEALEGKAIVWTVLSTSFREHARYCISEFAKAIQAALIEHASELYAQAEGENGPKMLQILGFEPDEDEYWVIRREVA